MAKRKYTLRERAARKQATRDRIVEATVALHEEVGPSRTTVSAIAERAGVQRLTVYRHFSDDRALLDACSTSWLELHPPPEPESWQHLETPANCTRAALSRLYAYYRSTERMWSMVYRDLDEVPALAEVMAGFEEYLRGIRADLVAAWDADGSTRPAIDAGLGHSLLFSTWRSLSREGLADGEMADLLVRWFECLAVPAGGS